MLHYEERASSCSRDVRLRADGEAEVISTPNYPSIPPSHIECVWVVTAPADRRIRLDFIERFDLSASTSSTSERTPNWK